ncbi:crosslink repair DNA glycosylase YcaQ family protein [Conexibacter sp. JD483]|uniref:DNA glycosylase AlkZ-like family protein n=1 Tax=unclassified Conexibacter TaxID=2627773 RepID=UPI0027223306|nr:MULTISPECIES: crosslink repair DNA glycosylase YcaQ family protein [unclassified Conexibacter]MDO8185772.1 crosslink repair DNA glycosylase YcaQ family protein [Conexibacter sp. CPCC 205706]MDO8199149.1 crosslink repair DNA glycosylase YcaQ family protein [Conexibacter sp. CPCC 205762]MDR9369906.1 crosslink repair DNA glycosylase YcaQ family protein [Conexibacter sp. JD483]
MEISPAQAVAFRLAAHGLAPRGDGGDPLAPLASWALQDSPPGTAAVALAARSQALDAGALDTALHDERSAVALYNPRTATAIVPAAEVVAYTRALRPAGADADGWRAVLGPRVLPDAGELAEPAAALDAALPAFAAALDGAELSRDDLHAELRERLPQPLLPWCDGCQSHHARRGLLVAAGLHGLLCIAGRAGRQPLFARTDQWLASAPSAWASSAAGAWASSAAGAGDGASDAGDGDTSGAGPVDGDSAAADLVRRYLRWYGPSTPALFAPWAGITPSQARAAWALVETELAEVGIASDDGSARPRRAWLLADDVQALADAEPQAGAILLAPGDPLLLARDRELLLPDPAQRRRAFAAINGPGVVLLDGAAAALWRGRKRGRTLEVAVEPLAERPLSRRALSAIEREAVRLAPHRGCSGAALA